MAGNAEFDSGLCTRFRREPKTLHVNEKKNELAAKKDATVGGPVYRPGHVQHEGSGAVVIDLAEARERLVALRASQNLTRQDTSSDGEGRPAHQRNLMSQKVLSPSAPRRTAVRTHPLIEQVLPDGLGPALSSPDSRTSIGRLSHAAIATLAPSAHTLHPDTLTETVLVLARALCPPGRMHRRNSTLVAGFANEYLRGVIRPRTPWSCIGTEVSNGTGRVDLAWRNTETGAVFFDEVKTTEVTRRVADLGWLDQCRRYSASGVTGFGDLFLGVRLLPLGSMNVAAFVTADNQVLALAPTAADPLSGTGLVWS